MKEKRRNRSMYHWVILVCCILTLMFSYSTRFGLSQLFVTEIIKETGFATSAYFLSATVASVICVFTGPIAGKLLRGKYMRRTFLICCIGTMGFYSCYGLCNELWQFYLVGALQGLFAMGACTMPVTVLITNWFDKNRGFMISVAMMGISLGGMILSPFIAWAIASYGWRKAYFILGGSQSSCFNSYFRPCYTKDTGRSGISPIWPRGESAAERRENRICKQLECNTEGSS